MTKVKICGLTNAADAQAALDAGADLLGFIFYEPSPRYVSPDTVKSIITGQLVFGANRPLLVGVFVDESPERVREVLDFCGLDAAQLHGSEPPSALAQLAGRAYKVFRPQSRAEFEQAMSNYQLAMNNEQNKSNELRMMNDELSFRLPPASLLPDLLLDAYHPTLYGGTGRVTDWSLAAEVARRHNVLLAGSLTPDTVAAAVRAVRPWGVDVSSGVETEKGRKDHARLRAFIKNVKRKT